MQGYRVSYLGSLPLFAILAAGCAGTDVATGTNSQAAVEPQAAQPAPEVAAPADTVTTPAPAETVGAPASGGGLKRPLPRIWFDPVDGTTGVGGKVPTISIDADGFRVDDAALASIRGTLSLAKWPTLEPVATTMQVAQVGATDQQAHVSLTPSAALANGWHVLKLPALPAGLAEPTFPSDAKLSDGSLAVRFRRDSAPTVWGVRVCEKGPGYSVIVDFSEPVTSSKPPSSFVSIAQGGKSLSCSAVESSYGGDGLGSQSFACALDAASSLDVRVSAGLASPAGAPLNAGADAAYSMVPSKLPDWGTGCTIYRPDAPTD
jgi:hypothetical protein